MFLVGNDRFESESADIVLEVLVEAVGALVFHRTHGIMVGEVAFKFVVLDNGLAPLTLVTERFTDEEHSFGSTLLVLGETFQHARALLDDLVVLHALFGRGRRSFGIGNAVEASGSHLGRLVVDAFRIEHVVQVCATSAAIENEGGKNECHVSNTEHGSKDTKNSASKTRFIQEIYDVKCVA